MAELTAYTPLMKRKKRNGNELYNTMRSAIAYLRAHVGERPDAASVARELGMSESRFNHLFAQWTGITPKHFLSYLTKEQVKRSLAESADVLSASHTSGLSGPGRLHDFLVTYEAVSPGEFRAADIEMTWGMQPCPFGFCLIALTKRGICHLSFIDDDSERKAVSQLRETWPKASLVRSDAKVSSYVRQIFSRKNHKRPISLLLKGTNFQVKVWEALLRIPEGKIASYADVARAAGSPRAVRAVGSACGNNPIGFIIPCHRVLASDGGLGGYHWDLERKEAILLWERVRRAVN